MSKPGTIRIFGIIIVVCGAIMIIAGLVTWFTVKSSLAEEHITVSSDAPRYAGDPVDGPLTAYTQAEVIQHHALESTGGKTYAQLDREDPKRATAMNASFLRASLFTSVVAFGVAFFAFGVGICMILIGLALMSLSVAVTRPAVVT